MPLQKQNLNINFSQGLDTKSDPKQVQPGKFLDLQNSVFSKGGLLQKRNGFKKLTSLPDSSSVYTATFNGNLTAIGTSLQAYSAGSQQWVNKGTIQPLLMDTLPLIRSNTNQSQSDTAVSPNGLVCTVFTDNVPVSGSPVAKYKYAIADVNTGQNIVAPTLITAPTGVITGSPRVFLLGNFFVIVFSNNITGTYHLQYVAININNPLSVTTAADISAQYVPATTVNWDGIVANNSLYISWNGSDLGGAIRSTFIDSTLLQHNTVIFTGHSATILTITADNTGSTPVIYTSFYDSATSAGYTFATSQDLSTVLAQTQIIASGTILNIASAAQNQVLTVFYETSNNYSYDSAIPTHFVSRKTVTQAGVVSSATVVSRSVGLASKAIVVDSVIYFVSVYSSVNQPTYFLMTSAGKIMAKLAYSNGSGYFILGLPSIVSHGTTIQFSYLIKDFITSTNKAIAAPATSAIYTQTGVNLATIQIGTSEIASAEIGGNLNITGGILWAYDGYVPVEQGFNVWPDNVELTAHATGGLMTAQQYYYQVTYEWSDNQGNIFRSAPSIPVTVTTAAAISSVTVNVPTLRLTYKTANPVKIVIYRWSVAQQTFYQVTSITNPILNDPTVDSIAYLDTLADSSIVGNEILYTTGGVVENIGPPACSDVSLYRSRLFLIDSEDKNLLWYSKQVIESTPVEMSDLFTIFVAPTIGTEGSTGVMRFTVPMDDKLIISKDNAFYYLVGNGPDNTGANNDFSEPVFITSTIGSSNKNSVVFVPQGLMFQASNGKGIWLLGRDLSTQYIGAPVEQYNSFSVLSAVNIPGTNQVRFTLSNGVILMYDYFYGQWGTFTNISAISSVIYSGLHTFINSRGEAYQENPGSYIDGARPVLMSFKTSFLNLAGIQGFQRAYSFFLIGEYISPHKLSMGIAYDYGQGVEQQSVITPENFNPAYGDDPFYGDDTYGGNPSLEQWQVFLQRQKCQSFQIQLQESFDPSLGIPAGAGFTLSALTMIVGLKGGTPKLKASLSIG